MKAKGPEGGGVPPEGGWVVAATDIDRLFEFVPELDPVFPDRAFVNVVFQR
jgi:hypothetical protein